MTDKEFLEAGHKYQDGDVIRGENGDVEVVGVHMVENYNKIDLGKDDWHVVYAAALENNQSNPNNDRLDRYVQAALTGLCSISGSSLSNISVTAAAAAMIGRAAMKAADNEQT